MSNFSFYYAHHLSTIEGGMICTNDEEIYQIVRMGRSHGMVRECTDKDLVQKYQDENPELNPEFIFAYPAYNMRNHEIGAVVGRNQLPRLDENNIKRNENYSLFLSLLDGEKYKVDFDQEGMSNYALNLVLKEADDELCSRVMNRLKELNVEFRRGSAGGGNQTRQPYLKGIVKEKQYLEYPNTEHIHFYGFYIGNYPDLPKERIEKLCVELNAL